MKDSHFVGVLHGASDREQRGDRIGTAPGRAIESLGEIAAIEILERKEHSATDFADLEQLHDIRMLQAGNGLGFGEKARAIAVACVIAGENHLQCHEPAKFFLPGEINDTHAATAEFANDFVAGNSRPRSQGCGLVA